MNIQDCRRVIHIFTVLATLTPTHMWLTTSITDGLERCQRRSWSNRCAEGWRRVELRFTSKTTMPPYLSGLKLFKRMAIVSRNVTIDRALLYFFTTISGLFFEARLCTTSALALAPVFSLRAR
jgi:hypothetical protein